MDRAECSIPEFPDTFQSMSWRFQSAESLDQDTDIIDVATDTHHKDDFPFAIVRQIKCDLHGRTGIESRADAT